MKSQARLQKALAAQEEPAHEAKKTEEAAQVEQEAEAKEGEDDSLLKEAIEVFQELTIKWETQRREIAPEEAAQKSWEQSIQANQWGTWGRREIAPGEEAVQQDTPEDPGRGSAAVCDEAVYADDPGRKYTQYVQYIMRQYNYAVFCINTSNLMRESGRIMGIMGVREVFCGYY